MTAYGRGALKLPGNCTRRASLTYVFAACHEVRNNIKSARAEPEKINFQNWETVDSGAGKDRMFWVLYYFADVASACMYPCTDVRVKEIGQFIFIEKNKMLFNGQAAY